MATFSKRHYEAVALAMQEAAPELTARNPNYVVERGQWEYTVEKLANAFIADNAQFKRNRFVLACQRGANVRARS